MVQKYESPVRIYKYPFELVVAVSAMISFAMLNCTPLCKPVALVGRSYTLTFPVYTCNQQAIEER